MTKNNAQVNVDDPSDDEGVAYNELEKSVPEETDQEGPLGTESNGTPMDIDAVTQAMGLHYQNGEPVGVAEQLEEQGDENWES